MSPGLTEFARTAFGLWSAGGWLMVPLALLSLAIYFTAMDTFIRLVGLGKWARIDPAYWRQCLTAPERARPRLRRLLEFIQAGQPDERMVRRRFEEARAEHLPVVDRRIRFLVTLVTATPLAGLLGTVVGMLATFQGLGARGAGGETAEIVAGGISQALITTQTGLVIAIPGLVIAAYIQRRRNLLEAFFMRLESVVLQRLTESADAGSNEGKEAR